MQQDIIVVDLPVILLNGRSREAVDPNVQLILPHRKLVVALISYFFGLFVYSFPEFVFGDHDAITDP